MQNSKLYVGNLSYSTAKETLQEVFSKHGEVKEVTLIEGKGFGFVEMSSQEEADAAIEALNGTDLEGRSIKVDKARPPKSRDNRGSGGYRGGSGGRDRGFRNRY